MLHTPKVPILNQDALHQLIQERFNGAPASLKDIPNPSLLLHADKAAKRIATAIANKERITLVGDYDVDGVTSTALTILFFRDINYPLEAIIPNRFLDGYGVSASVLERVDADLVITVDNGISAIEAANICKARGIDLIITDHHTPSETLPDAFAIVNPKLAECPYPFKEICGAQVAWLLWNLVKKELKLDINMANYLDLLALAIVADVMPLIGINRAMVIAGLRRMGTSNRPSMVIIRAFLNRSELSSEDIGFQIAPRINSAGRLEDASIALDFLTAESEEKAAKQFELLDQLNTLRKATEADATEMAMLEINDKDKVIVCAGENWHEGVVGIVAARLVQKYNKPAIILNITGGMAKGSARSLGEVDIFKLISSQKEHIEKFGGHMMAAGLSLKIENLETFTKQINIEANKLDDDAFLPKEVIVGELESSSLNPSLLQTLQAGEPYGEANPRPSFVFKNAEVVSIKLFGADKSHSRITLRLHPHERQTHELIAFRQVLEMPESRTMSCSYTINKNEFNGRITMQMILSRIYS